MKHFLEIHIMEYHQHGLYTILHYLYILVDQFFQNQHLPPNLSIYIDNRMEL